MRKTENPNDLNQSRLNMLQKSIMSIPGQGDLFYNIIDFIPYPIEVYAQDGTIVMVNRAMLREFDLSGNDIVMGKYNIFKDPEIGKPDLTALVKEIFDSKARTMADIKVSVKFI